jgi:hypothetical protein
MLHIAETAADIATVDLRLGAAGLVLFAVVLGAVWLPRRPFALHARFRRRVAAVTMSLLVVLAVAPSVLPYDHVFGAGGHDAGHTSSVHTDHCHVNPGGCADTPVTSGPGQLIQSAPLIVLPAVVSTLVLLVVPALMGIVPRPDLRPPLSSVNA